MFMRALMLATVAAAALSTPAVAQTVVSSLEGKLEAIVRQARNPTTGLIEPAHFKVFDTKVYFKADNATVISSPTRDKFGFGVLNTCNSTQIPGFAKLTDTLIGGTAIATGISSETGVVADTLFVEPFEHVLLGRVTSVPQEKKNADGTVSYEGKLTIDGTQVIVLAKSETEQYTKSPEASTTVFNPCFPGKGAKNAFAIDIPPSNLRIGAETAAEGWFGEDRKFYAFLIEGEGGVATQPVSVGIARAQCRNRGAGRGLEWELRGGVGVFTEAPPKEKPTDPAMIPFTDARGSIVFGRAVQGVFRAYDGSSSNIVVDPVDRGYGSFNARPTVNSGLATGEGCPETVIVRYTPTGGGTIAKPGFVTARSGVDAR
jgi:hypothetical protein